MSWQLISCYEGALPIVLANATFFSFLSSLPLIRSFALEGSLANAKFDGARHYLFNFHETLYGHAAFSTAFLFLLLYSPSPHHPGYCFRWGIPLVHSTNITYSNASLHQSKLCFPDLPTGFLLTCRFKTTIATLTDTKFHQQKKQSRLPFLSIAENLIKIPNGKLNYANSN